MPRRHAASARRALALALTLASAGACGAPSRVPAGPAARIDSLLHRGDATYRRAPDSARALWERARAEAAAAGDSVRLARALTGLGQAARLLGDFAEARRRGEQALALAQRLDMRADLFRAYNALGLLAWREERLGDAVVLLDRAADAARQVRDSVGLVKASLNAGLVAQDLGRYDRARAAFVGARDAARALGDSAILAAALDNLAALDIAMGDPAAAIAGLEAARRVAHATGDSTVEVNAIGQLATAYDALGEPQRAFALLDSALAMAERAGRRQEAAENLKLLADLFGDAGDHRHALDYYRRARAATDSLDQPEERGNILRNEARAHAALGNLALAEQRAGEARRVHRAGGFAYPELSDALLLASLAQRAGRRADAESLLRAASTIAATLDAPVAGARVAIAEAGVAAEAGDWRRVLRVLDRAGGTLALAGSGAEADALMLRARALAALGQLDAALAAGRRAIGAVERVRRSYASGELRTSYASTKADVYAAHVLLLLRMGRSDEAFDVADAARGRALLEHLASARADVRGAGAGGALLAQELLLRRIEALVARLRQQEARAPRERSPALLATTAELRDSVLAARAEYEALVARGAVERAVDPEAAGRATFPFAFGPSTAQATRRSLEPGEVLLEYFVTPDRLLIFAMTASRLTTYTVETRAEDLASRVQLARELMQRRDEDGAARGVLAALHDVVLGPVAASGVLREARRLIVVPHGALTYLPFAALVDPRTGRYVAESYTVLHLPTSASLPVLRAVASGGGSPNGWRTAEVFAPFPDSLPATRDEAASVGRALPGAAVHVGARATEPELRRALASGAIVHVATHARMNGRNPLFSDVELAGGGAGGPSDDGRLEVHELLALRVDAPLVFLSGCETALGGAWATRFDTGEDYTTIAQTLLFSGARNVVATLWRIDDAGAAAFAKRFYGALEGGTVPEALVRAQRQMLADPRFHSPYYWAPYEASGGGVALDGRAKTARVSDRPDRR